MKTGWPGTDRSTAHCSRLSLFDSRERATEKERGRRHWHWSHAQDPEHVGQEQGGLSTEQGEMMGAVLGNLLGFEVEV